MRGEGGVRNVGFDKYEGVSVRGKLGSKDIP